MTLLELVVALAVTGIALAGGAAAFSTLVDARERGSTAADEHQRTTAIRSAIESWIAGARLTIEQDGVAFEGLNATHDAAGAKYPNDELILLTTSRTPLGTGDANVRLLIDRDSLTPERGLVAEFSHRHARQAVIRRLELTTSVAGLELEYLSGVMGGPRQWLPSWVSETILPSAVRIVLTPAEGDSLPALLARPIVVPLTVGR